MSRRNKLNLFPKINRNIKTSTINYYLVFTPLLANKPWEKPYQTDLLYFLQNRRPKCCSCVNNMENVILSNFTIQKAI